MINTSKIFVFVQNVKKVVLLVLVTAAAAGCSAFYSSATSRLAENLSWAFENQTDTEVVRNGTPAYLLMMDALIRQSPKNASLLRSAAALNASYAEIFVKDLQRSKTLTAKALELAVTSACLENKALCNIRTKNYDDFQAAVKSAGTTDIDSLYTLGAVWASWIQTHSKDWNAVAELSRVEAIMQRIVSLNPEYDNGGAFLYLGTLATLLPPALGGEPEKGKRYFEKALALSEGKNLYAKVLYARQYARLVFDQQLHDSLLRDVLAADPNVEGYALINSIARKEAEILLESSDNYF